MKTIVPQEMPPVPEDWVGWRRSRRAGSIYHLQCIGVTACGSFALADRHNSEPARHLGDMQYWGVCPRCMKKAQA